MKLAILLAHLWPQVQMSYEYHPRQAWPSHVESLTGDPWPIDSFWETNGLQPNYSDNQKGERHYFWVNLSWDFEHSFEVVQAQTTRLFKQIQLRTVELRQELSERLYDLSKQSVDDLVEIQIEVACQRAYLLAMLVYYDEMALSVYHSEQYR